jgi:hypothetical protein
MVFQILCGMQRLMILIDDFRDDACEGFVNEKNYYLRYN